MAESRRGQDQNPFIWFTTVLALSLIVRLTLWFVYEPVEYSDSGAYFRIAQALQDFTISGHDGSRVPGYPFFIVILGLDPHRIWAAQMMLGVLASALLFWITWKTTDSVLVGFVMGGLQAVFPASVLFEANLLTETLTFFLIMLSLALFLVYRQAGSISIKFVAAFMLGMVASLVGLVRPIFFPLTLWVLPFIWFGDVSGYKQRISAVVIYSLFPLILQGGWLYFMKTHYHVLSPTAIGGYSMVQHSGEFFEDLPDEYAVIRDVYIEYRDEQIAERGSQNNAIWQAVPVLIETTGLSFYELSRELNDLSWMLIRKHPFAYALNVFEGWIWFWKAPVYWRADLISSLALRATINAWIFLGRVVAIAVNTGFLAISFGMVLSHKIREWVKIDPMHILVGGLIGWTSIIQSLFEHGDNPRFLVPLQMIVIYLVVRSLFNVRQSMVRAK
jgi:hypothetical protein